MQSPSHTYTHLHVGGEQKNHINAELDNHSKIKVIDGKCPFWSERWEKWTQKMKDKTTWFGFGWWLVWECQFSALPLEMNMSKNLQSISNEKFLMVGTGWS